MLEESELKPYRRKLGKMVLKDLEGATDAASLQAAIDTTAGATGKKVEAALSVARSRLAELRNSERWKGERVEAGVDHHMPYDTDGVTLKRPEDHCCPIGGIGEPMFDPVTAADGMTYERAAIEEWLRGSNRSPVTGAELPHTLVVPNQALKIIIRDWEEQEHKKCMAMAAAQAAAPPPLRQTTSRLVAQRDDLNEQIQQRKKAKLATAQGASSSSAAAASTADEK